MKPKSACLGSVPLFGCQRPRLTTLAINLTFSIRRLNAMQKVLLIGNLGRDPEVKCSQQGMAIAQFSVATTERWKDKGGEPQEHTEWFAVKAFGHVDVCAHGQDGIKPPFLFRISEKVVADPQHQMLPILRRTSGRLSWYCSPGVQISWASAFHLVGNLCGRFGILLQGRPRPV